MKHIVSVLVGTSRAGCIHGSEALPHTERAKYRDHLAALLHHFAQAPVHPVFVTITQQGDTLAKQFVGNQAKHSLLIAGTETHKSIICDWGFFFF